MIEFNVTIEVDNFTESSEIFSVTLSIVSGNSRVLIDSNADTATITILDSIPLNQDDSTLLSSLHFIIHWLIFAVITIGFNPTAHNIREEVGFVTWTIVASGPVPSDTVLRLTDITEGIAGLYLF